MKKIKLILIVLSILSTSFAKIILANTNTSAFFIKTDLEDGNQSVYMDIKINKDSIFKDNEIIFHEFEIGNNRVLILGDSSSIYEDYLTGITIYDATTNKVIYKFSEIDLYKVKAIHDTLIVTYYYSFFDFETDSVFLREVKTLSFHINNQQYKKKHRFIYQNLKFDTNNLKIKLKLIEDSIKNNKDNIDYKTYYAISNLLFGYFYLAFNNEKEYMSYFENIEAHMQTICQKCDVGGFVLELYNRLNAIYKYSSRNK